jgi:hypothetical protein
MDSQAQPRATETPPIERDGKPPHGGWCRSCETPPAELLQPRGCSPHEEAHNDRRHVRTVASDLPQPVLPQTPLVAHQHPPPSGTDDDERPHGFSTPAGAELGLSQRQRRIPDALTGELARRARNAETSRALKGRLMSTLAKAPTLNRTQSAFHPQDQRLLSRDAGKRSSQPWSPTAAQTASTPLLPVTTMTLTRSFAPLAQPTQAERPNECFSQISCSALEGFCVCGSSLA